MKTKDERILVFVNVTKRWREIAFFVNPSQEKYNAISRRQKIQAHAFQCNRVKYKTNNELVKTVCQCDFALMTNWMVIVFRV